MWVTLREVAKAAGVSQATASRVLRGNRAEAFAENTRRRVHAVAQRLGYRPNPVAQALATGRSRLVTFWCYRPFQAFFARVMEQMDREAENRNFGLLVADVAAREANDPAVTSAVWPSDGLLAMDCGAWAERIARMQPSPRTPIISMGTSLVPGTDCVKLDMGSAFQGATSHLLEQGCRRIAYFSSGPPSKPAWSGQLMFATPREAYLSAMGKAGRQEELLFVDGSSRSEARRWIVDYIREHGCPEAIVCRNDDLALGCYRAMCDLGIRVGHDVLLTGCDGIEDTEYLDCPLTTIVLPVPEMCETAWQFLETRMADPAAPLREATLEARLEARASSRRG